MGKIDDLQTLRAVAIFAVLFSHLSLPTAALHSVGLVNTGWLGVELFFVLSGFVVTKSLLRQDFNGWAFVVRRAFRLYPALFVFFALCLACNALAAVLPDYVHDLFWVDPELQGQQLLSLLLMTFPEAHGFSYTTGSVWSLMTEFRYYAAVAVLCIVLGGFSRPVVVKAAFVALAFAVLTVGIAARVAMFFDFQFWLGSAIIGPKFEFIALGILIAFLPTSTVAVINRITARLWPILLFSPFLATLFLRDVHAAHSGPGDLLESFVMIATFLCFGTVVLAGSKGHITANMPRRLTLILNMVGDRSYTIFLLHFPAMLLAWALCYAINPAVLNTDPTWLFSQAAATTLILVPIVEITYRFIEMPLNDQGGRISRRMLDRRDLKARASALLTTQD